MRHASPMDTPALHALVPLAATLALRVAAAAPDGVTVELDHRPELCTAGGVLHGGAIMALADTAGALCAHLNLPEGAAGTTTVESKTNLLAAVRAGTLTASATPLHVGSRLVVVETELRRGDGRPAAQPTQTPGVLARGGAAASTASPRRRSARRARGRSPGATPRGQDRAAARRTPPACMTCPCRPRTAARSSGSSAPSRPATGCSPSLSSATASASPTRSA